MLARTLARRTLRAFLILVGVSIVGFGLNALMEQKLVDEERRFPAGFSLLEEVGVPMADRYIGLPENAAVRAIRSDDLQARLMWRDGVRVEVLGDRRDDRVNLYIQDGIVVDARRY